LQDPEIGISRGLSTEEAIQIILVKSYDSSEISHQVQKQLYQIKKLRVSFVTHHNSV